MALFIFYQLPEGVGGRWLQQPMITAGLMLAFLPIAWLVARALGIGMGTAYALEWNRRTALYVVMGILVAFATKLLAVALGLRLGIYVSSQDDVASGPSLTPAFVAGMAIYSFVPSISEDIVTRGFWARIPPVRWTAMRFVLATAVIYLLNHIYRLSNGPTEWLMIFCFGLAYATAAWRLGSLWAAVGLHWGWNFAGQTLLVAWPVDAASVDSARVLSGIAHVAILAIVCLLPARGGLTERSLNA